MNERTNERKKRSENALGRMLELNVHKIYAIFIS